jgi:ribosomal protein L37AE/L43A
MKGSYSLASRPGSLVCPLCEMHKLDVRGHSSLRCDSCGGLLSGAMLETLRQITTLPDALGSHACEECGHPQMRLLPDGTRHCPSCGSEVLPIDTASAPSRPDEYGEAYWAGWVDGRFGKWDSFVDNLNLARWNDPPDRLNYYRGHRAGSEARRTANGKNPGAREKLIG